MKQDLSSAILAILGLVLVGVIVVLVSLKVVFRPPAPQAVAAPPTHPPPSTPAEPPEPEVIPDYVPDTAPKPPSQPQQQPVNDPRVQIVPTQEPPPRSRSLATLGKLASTVYDGRDGWRVEPAADGFVELQSRDRSPGVVHYFFIQRNRPRPIDTSVSVSCLGEGGMAGLIYGNIQRKDYYLIGVTSEGQIFVKHRGPGGLTNRVQSSVGQGPQRVALREVGGGLAVFFNGEQRITIGGGASPTAAVGVFVLGTATGRFRGFEFSQE